MATPYRLKRSSVASKRPKLTDLDKGELALNFYDGHLFAERDTNGVGIGTTIANLTPWKESFGGTAINYENSVGIGSDDPIAKLDVVGQTELDDLNVSGIATFKGNIDADGNLDLEGYLDVDGQAELDDLNVAGIATFSGGLDINGTAEFERLVVTPGITTSVGGLHVGTGGTILSTGLGRVGVNTTQAGTGFEFEVYGNINIVGDDVEYYQNGARRTAGVGIQTNGNVVAGFGATIINFVGSAVSSIVFDATAGIATVNLNRGEFTRTTQTFTASADQTTFSATYVPGFIDVFVNGVRQTGADFTATNGSSVVLVQPSFAGDVVDIVAFSDEGFVDSKWSHQEATPGNIFYNNGKVGIGTAVPRQKFDVEGNINIVGIATFTDRVILTGTNSIQIPVGTEQQKDAIGSAVTGQIRYNTTNVQFEGFGAGGQWGSLGGVKDVDGDTFITAETSAGSDDDALSFTTAGTVRAILDSTGKVGIGTTIPAQKLHVFGNTGTNIQIEQTSENTSGNIYLGSSGNTRFGLSSGANLIQSTSVDFAIGSFGGNSLIFGTNNFERLRISSTGAVGIGTTIPRQKFDVEGNVNIVGITTVVGSLGIGVAPTVNLHSYHATTNTVAKFESGDSSVNIRFKDGDTTNEMGIGAMGNDFIVSAASGGERLRVTSAGAVGIGTTIPKGDLDIGEQFSVKSTTTTVATTTSTAIDTLAISTYRSARFQVQITQGTSYQSSDLMVIHDGITPAIIEYASVATSDYLGDFSAAISGSNLLLKVSMNSNTSATVKVVRYGISV